MRRFSVCVLIALLLLGVSPAWAADDAAFTLMPSERDAMEAYWHRPLVFGYSSDSEYYTQPDGTALGVLQPLFELMRNVFGLNIEIRFYAPDELRAAVASGEVDMVGYLPYEDAGTDDALLSREILSMPYAVYTHGRYPLSNPEALSGKLVGVLGSAELPSNARLTAALPEDCVVIGYPTSKQLLDALNQGLIAAAVTTVSLDSELIRYHDIVYEMNYGVLTQSMCVEATHQKDAAVISLLNRFLKSQSGAAFLQRVESARLELVRYLTRERLAGQIERLHGQQREIHIYLPDDIYPYSFWADGRLQGETLQILDEFSTVTGLPVTVLAGPESSDNISRLTRMIDRNELQAVGLLMPDRNYERQYAYSLPVFTSSLQLYLPYQNDDSSSRFVAGAIGVGKDILDQFAGSDAWVGYFSMREMMSDFEEGKLGGLILSEAQADYRYNVLGKYYLGGVSAARVDASYHFLLGKKNTVLNALLDETIQQFTRMRPLYARYQAASLSDSSFAASQRYYYSEASRLQNETRLTLFVALAVLVVLSFGTGIFLWVRYNRFTRRIRDLLMTHEGVDLVVIDLRRGTVSSSVSFSMFRGRIELSPHQSLDRFGQLFHLDMPEHYRDKYHQNAGDRRFGARRRRVAFHDIISHGIGKQQRFFAEYGQFLSPNSLVLSLMDITPEKQRERDLEQIVGVDPVTGMYDRRVMSEKSVQLMDKYPDSTVVFLLLKLWDLKSVTERCGYEAGDAALQEVARKLRRFENEKTVLFHVVSDEFGICAAGLKGLSGVAGLVAQVAGIKLNVDVRSQKVSMRYHIGYATSKDIETSGIDNLVEYAAFALFLARRTDTAVLPFDRDAYHSHLNYRYQLEEYDKLATQIQLYPVYQPIIDLHTNELYGFEALSRPQNISFANIQQVIDIAYIKNDTLNLNLMMLEKAIATFPRKRYPNAKLFLNVDFGCVTSEEQLFATDIHLFDPDRIPCFVFEVTERYDIQQFSVVENILNYIRERGGLVALDDYGAGYSNESSLVRIQPNIVKLDHKIIENIDKNPYRQHFVRQFVAFARLTQTLVLAEGIETEAELRVIRELDCDLGQGYFLGRPNRLD